MQGTVWAGVRPWPWLELSAARRIRAFVTDTATERWGTWQGRIRVGGPILGPWLDSYAALWWGTAPQGAGGSARGGQVSVVVAPGALVSFKLSYSLDQVELPGGSGFAIGPVQLGGGSSASQEIVEQLSVGAVLNLR